MSSCRFRAPDAGQKSDVSLGMVSDYIKIHPQSAVKYTISICNIEIIDWLWSGMIHALLLGVDVFSNWHLRLPDQYRYRV